MRVSSVWRCAHARVLPVLLGSEPPHVLTPRSFATSLTRRPFVVLQPNLYTRGGWGGRIRTFNLLIQSQLRYRCATPQGLLSRRASLFQLLPGGGGPTPGRDARERPLALPGRSEPGSAGAKLLLILLRQRWDHLAVDPLRPRGFYPPRGFFFLIRLLRDHTAPKPATDGRLATTPG